MASSNVQVARSKLPLYASFLNSLAARNIGGLRKLHFIKTPHWDSLVYIDFLSD